MFFKLVSIGSIPDLIDVKTTFCASYGDIQVNSIDTFYEACYLDVLQSNLWRTIH